LKPPNRGGLRWLFATGRRGAVICGLYRERGAIAPFIHTRIAAFCCRPAVRTVCEAPPRRGDRRVPRARTHVKSYVRAFTRGAVHTRIGAFRCRPAVRTGRNRSPSFVGGGVLDAPSFPRPVGATALGRPPFLFLAVPREFRGARATGDGRPYKDEFTATSRRMPRFPCAHAR
jgi:hypothetical protein